MKHACHAAWAALASRPGSSPVTLLPPHVAERPEALCARMRLTSRGVFQQLRRRRARHRPTAEAQPPLK